MQVVQASWDDALSSQQGRLRGVLSNPPYITDAAAASLQVSLHGSCSRMGVSCIQRWLPAPVLCKGATLQHVSS